MIVQVKRNMTKVRETVTQYLWTMTQNTQLIREDVWLQNTTHRLQVLLVLAHQQYYSRTMCTYDPHVTQFAEQFQEFEADLLRAMKKGGWDGSESEHRQQWTWHGALFYSIVVITTIGKS